MGAYMTPLMIPQVFLIKWLIRELVSKGLAGIACLIIVYEIIKVPFFSVGSGRQVMEEQREVKSPTALNPILRHKVLWPELNQVSPA